MDGNDEEKKKKLHHKRQAGPKADKKKAKNKHEQELTAKQRNPKAFAVHSVNKVAKAVRRTLDIRERKHHVPVVDRTPVEPPPIVIAVVGPPKVGKTTLIQCLIKNFTRYKLSKIQGPVTIVSGKKRRLTILECNNDINSMIDVAKVADLVLLLVDASFGFEMEIFEFLNICQVHGFPKIMGVLTHLDHFRNNKALRKTKKRLKHRFWTEVYQGAKLFYLSGMVNGEYQRTEVHNLGRFISVMKFRPLQWRTTHPYLLADRIEDVTDPEAVRQNPKVDRSVCMYGYIRGTHFKNKSNIHIPGCGDFTVHDMSILEDPCPLPDSQGKRRRLNEKERSIYAPFSGVGGIVYDKDAIYIDTGGSHSHQKEEEGGGPTNEFVSQLIEAQKTIDEKLEDSQLTLFKGGPSISASELDSRPKVGIPEEIKVVDENGRVRRKALLTGDESDAEEDDDEESESEEDDIDSGEDEDIDSEDEEEEKNEPEGKKSSKKLKLDLDELAYADSDDDLETQSPKICKTTKRSGKVEKKVISEETSEESETDDEEEDSSSEDEDDKDEENAMGSDENSCSDVEDEIIIRRTKSARTSSGLVPDTSLPTEVTKGHTQSETDVADKSESDEDDSMDEDGDEDESGYGEEDGGEDDGDKDDGDDDEEENESGGEETGHLKWKENLAAKAQEAFYRRQNETPNLRKLVYGYDGACDEDEGGKDDQVGGLFRVAKHKVRESRKATANNLDCSVFRLDHMQDWDLEDVKDQIRDCFVTGTWDDDEDAETLLKNDDELYGDFEDLETGEVHKAGEKEGSDEEEKEDKDEDDDKPRIHETREEERQRKVLAKRIEKKKRLKEMFNKDYDDTDGQGTYFDTLKTEMEEQAQLNRAEFENMDEETRAQYEGLRPGLYARVQVNGLACEFINNFDPTYPVILGALLSAEQNIGCVQVRLKKHRWHRKILKTRDPLIVSLGWRRFQTIALYSIQDHNMRHRLLKYTPEHLHCNASFWGPITPQGTGILAVQTLSGNTSNFRICATGVVLELDKSMTIVKKLKLTGTPSKIYRKTAFIEGMFNSQLEVSRFEGSSIRSVSGIRGQIKKAANTPQGAFRATFEDKILLSDIVFVRTWYPVAMPKFYNPVTTLLLPPDEKEKWQGMKTVGQLRRERSLRREVNEDTLYKPVERQSKSYDPLVIPKRVQQSLPFKDKPKVAKKIFDPVQSSRIAIVRDTKDKKVANLMKMLKVLNQEKLKKRREEMSKRVTKHRKEMAYITSKRDAKSKEVKKQAYRALGKMEKREEKAARFRSKKGKE